jgi:hypothetical protein
MFVAALTRRVLGRSQISPELDASTVGARKHSPTIVTPIVPTRFPNECGGTKHGYSALLSNIGRNNCFWCLDCRGHGHCWIANGLDAHWATAHGRRLGQPLSGSQRRQNCGTVTAFAGHGMARGLGEGSGTPIWLTRCVPAFTSQGAPRWPTSREHMEVIGADGVHVGTVDKVEGNRIKLTKKTAVREATRVITTSLFAASSRGWRATRSASPRTVPSPSLWNKKSRAQASA